MIAWCGSRADGLAWLCDRCSTIYESNVLESLSIDSLDTICSRHPHRLILSVENRLNYPVAEIQHLQRSWPEIPWALALGSWFDGSRRTGIGSTIHLSLPWYRWWDGWRPWLSGSSPVLLNPWPQLALTRSPVVAKSGLSATSRGVILSNCRPTGEAWQAGLECDPEQTHLLTLSEFRLLLAKADPVAPDWLLWDDTCLDTFAGAGTLTEICGLFEAIRRQFPGVVIFAATSMPRWSDWQRWLSAGANELLAKPTQGVLLRELFPNSLILHNYHVNAETITER